MQLFLLHFISVWHWIWAYQQLLELFFSHYFASSDPPLTFSYTSEQLCIALYVDSYALTTFHALPSTPQEFLSIKTQPGRSSLKATQISDGSVSVSILTCEISYALQTTALPINVWLHFGMSLDSLTQQVLVSAISWTGVQIVRAQSLCSSLL